MSSRRQPVFPCNIKSLYEANVLTAEVPTLAHPVSQQPLGYIKCYGTVTERKVDVLSNINPIPMYSLKLDDGTGAVWVKTTSTQAEDIQEWDFVRVIGVVILDTADENQFELSVNPEVIIKVDDKRWELVHVLEAQRALISKQPSPGFAHQSSTHPEFSDSPLPSTSTDGSSQSGSSAASASGEGEMTLDGLTKKIEQLLRTLDTGNGVETAQLLAELGDDVDETSVDDILFELAYEGKVYQPRPDYYKIME